MTPEDLKALFGRLTRGPVPTQKKKVFAYSGRLATLLEMIPGTVLVQGSVFDAVEGASPSLSEEALARFMAKALADHATKLRAHRTMSVVVLTDAAVLARYQVPLTALFECVSDGHAVVLHVAEDLSTPSWTVPSYIRFEPTEVWRYFETALPDQAMLLRRTEV